jgi:teichuronic acid exporter
MSLKQQAVSGVFWTTLNTFSAQAISFFVSIILARLLLPSEFGLLAMLAVFIGMGNVLVNSGMSMSLIRTKDVDDEDFSIVFFFNLIASIVVYFIVFFFSKDIASFYNQPILENIIKIYALTFIIDAFSTVQSTLLTRNLDFKTQMKVSFPSLIGSSIVGIAMAYLGYGVWSLVFAAVTKSVFASVQLWYWSKWRPALVFNLVKLKYHWNFGYKLLISGLLDNFFVNIYAIIIGKFFLSSQAGYFQRADSLKQFPVGVLSNILNKVTFPLFSKLQDDINKLKELYSRLMITVVFFVAPLLFTMAALGDPLFRFLFTEKWLSAVPYFQILCFNGVLYPIHSYNLNVLNLKGRSDLYLKLEIFKKIATVAILLIALNFGIYGLLYGSVLLSVFSFFVNTHYSGKFLNYSAFEQIKDIVPYILFGLGIALFAYGIDFTIGSQYSDFTRLLMGSLFSLSVFVGISHFFKLAPYLELRGLLKK